MRHDSDSKMNTIMIWVAVIGLIYMFVEGFTKNGSSDDEEERLPITYRGE